jgi:hypothetical protein
MIREKGHLYNYNLIKVLWYKCACFDLVYAGLNVNEKGKRTFV